MLTLYHTIRAVCPQKVRLAMAEKGLSYESRVLSRDDLRSPAYLSLNPNGYAPTLVHGDAIITESRTISEYLDEAFEDQPLMPVAPAGRARVRNWSKRIDDSLHLNIFILSFAISFRDQLLSLTDDEKARILPLAPLKRHIALDLWDRGFDSPFFGMGVSSFRTVLADMNAALDEAEWLSGENYGLADTDYTPYLRRLEELGFWQRLETRHPRVARWYDAVRDRPSFDKAITAWESEADREREIEDIQRAAPIFQAVLAD